MLTFIKKKDHHITSISMSERNLEHVFDVDFFAENPKALGIEVFHSTFTNHHIPAPQGYGLVMVDFDAKWIGSLQRFLPLDHIASVMTLRANPIAFQKLWNQGFFTQGLFLDANKVQTLQSLTEAGKTFVDLMDIAQWKASRRRAVDDSLPPLLTSILFEPPGWKIEAYPETLDGYAQLAQAMANREMDVLSHLDAWQAHLQGQFKNPERFQTLLSESLRNTLETALPSTPPKASSPKFL